MAQWLQVVCIRNPNTTFNPSSTHPLGRTVSYSLTNSSHLTLAVFILCWRDTQTKTCSKWGSGSDAAIPLHWVWSAENVRSLLAAELKVIQRMRQRPMLQNYRSGFCEKVPVIFNFGRDKVHKIVLFNLSVKKIKSMSFSSTHSVQGHSWAWAYPQLSLGKTQDTPWAGCQTIAS